MALYCQFDEEVWALGVWILKRQLFCFNLYIIYWYITVYLLDLSHRRSSSGFSCQEREKKTIEPLSTPKHTKKVDVEPS